MVIYQTISYRYTQALLNLDNGSGFNEKNKLLQLKKQLKRLKYNSLRTPSSSLSFEVARQLGSYPPMTTDPIVVFG